MTTATCTGAFWDSAIRLQDKYRFFVFRFRNNKKPSVNQRRVEVWVGPLAYFLTSGLAAAGALGAGAGDLMSINSTSKVSAEFGGMPWLPSSP